MQDGHHQGRFNPVTAAGVTLSARQHKKPKLRWLRLGNLPRILASR